MLLIDEKFKDESPKVTYEKIERILKENGISVTEHWNQSGVNHCHSLRVTIDGTNAGSNGKGLTRDLARASAYAELMERLQSGFLGLGDLEYCDSQELNPKELMDTCGEWFSAIAASASAESGKTVTPESIAQACFALEGKPTVTVIPYYNVNDDCLTAFPVKPMPYIYGSTGLAAGNSIEEALVQGYSEIVERRALMKFMKGGAVPPTVPETYLRQFEMAHRIIEEIRAAGYDVIIKDCSMGEGYPVVASVIIDRRTHGYHVHLGSSPIFEIALERSLTEMFQGRSLASIAETKNLLGAQNGNRSVSDIHYAIRTGSGVYPIEFFGENASYPFAPFADHSDKTNRELLKLVVEHMKKKGHKMLIRDLSHLGFHTYRIIIPGLSEDFYTDLTTNVPVWQFTADTRNLMTDLAAINEAEAFELKLLLQHQIPYYFNMVRFSDLTKLPLGLDAKGERKMGRLVLAFVEWKCGNRQAALKHAEAALPVADAENEAYLSCLCKLPLFTSKGESFLDGLEKLSRFYQKEVVAELREVLAQDQNPFARFMLHCAPEYCEACKYRETCCVMAKKAVTAKVNAAGRTFDSAAGLAALAACFKKIKE